jgi:hypothetical protein
LMWFLSHNIPKRNKLAEKISQKNLEYMLNYSLPCSLFRLGILWDKNHIKIFCSEIWVKMIFGWPTFKISRNWQLKKFLILVTAAILHGGWHCQDTILKRDHTRTIPAKFALIWFNSFGILWDKNLIKIFCSEIWVKMIFGWPTFKIMCNTPIFYQLLMSNWKPGERLQNSSHLEWRAALSVTILKRDHPRTIPAKFALIWFSGFRGEDLNVIFYQFCEIFSASSKFIPFRNIMR